VVQVARALVLVARALVAQVVLVAHVLVLVLALVAPVVQVALVVLVLVAALAAAVLVAVLVAAVLVDRATVNVVHPARNRVHVVVENLKNCNHSSRNTPIAMPRFQKAPLSLNVAHLHKSLLRS
jgi:hypothetical protein